MNRSLPHRRRVRILAAAITALLTGMLTLAACSSSGPDQTASGNQVSQSTYTEFNKAVGYPFAKAAPSDPLERINLATRLKQYNSAGDTNYVYIFAWGSSTPIGYYVIKGKVSSTGSQMTATQITTGCGSGNSGCVIDAIGDDGSYGPEEGGQNGVFFFTTTGTLVETDQPFVVSSAPIKLYVNVPQLDAPAK